MARLGLPEAWTRPRIRRPWLRRLLRTLLYGGLFAVLLVLFLLGTRPGRHLLLRSGEAIASHYLSGKLHIGELQGDLLHRLILEDLRLAPQNGDPVVALKAVKLSSQQGFWRLPIRIDLVRVELNALDLPGLLSMLPNADPEPEADVSEPFRLPDFPIRIARLEVVGEQLKLSQAEAIPKVALSATAELKARRLSLPILKAEGSLQLAHPKTPLPVSLWFQGALSEASRLSLEGQIQAAEATLRLHRAEASLEDQAAELALQLPPGLVATFAGDPKLQLPASLDLKLDHPKDQAIQLRINGQIAKAEVDLKATLDADLNAASLALHIAKLKPQEVYPGLLKGQLGLQLEAKADALQSKSKRQIQLQLHSQGRLKPPGLPERSLKLALSGSSLGLKRATAKIALQSLGAHLKAEAELRDLQKPRIQKAELRLDGLNLAEIGLQTPVLAGEAKLRVHASGPLDRLKAQLEAEVRQLSADALSLKHAKLNADLTGLWAKTSGKLRLEAQGFRQGELYVKRLSLEGRIKDAQSIQLALEAKADKGPFRGLDLALHSEIGQLKTLAIQRLELATVGPKLSLKSGSAPVRLELDGKQLRLSPLSLSSEAGSLLAEAEVRLDRWMSPDSQFRLELRQLDLAAWRALHQLPIEGLLNAELKLPRGPEGPKLRLQIVRFRAPGLSPWQLRLHASEARQNAKLRLALESPNGGSLQLHAALRTPKRLDDAAAWKRLRERVLKSAELDVRKLQLARIPALSQALKLKSGQMNGKLEIGSGLSRAKGEIQIDRLVSSAVKGRFDLKLHTDVNREKSDIRARLQVDQVERMRLDFRADIGGTELVQGGLPALLKGDIQLQLEAPPIEIAELGLHMAAPPGIPPSDAPISGLASLKLHATHQKGRTQGELQLKVADLSLWPAHPKLKSELKLHLKPGQTDLFAELSGHRLGRALLDAKIASPKRPLKPSAWQKLGPKAIEQASLTLLGLELDALWAALGMDLNLSGQLTAKAKLAKALEGAEVDLAVERLQLGPKLRQMALKLHANADAEQVRADLDAKLGIQAALHGEGKLALGLPALLRGQDPMEAPVEAEIKLLGAYLESFFNSPYVASSVHARLLGEAKLEGSLKDPALDAKLWLDDALISGMKLDTFEVEARYAASRLAAKLALSELGGGELRAELKPTERAELSVQARQFELSFLGALSQIFGGPAMAFDGSLNGQLRGQLTALGKPQLNGDLRITLLRAAFPGAPPITGGELRLLALGSTLQLQLDAEAGRGRLSHRGDITLDPLKLSGRWTLDKVHQVVAGTMLQITLDGSYQGQSQVDGFDLDLRLADGLIWLPDIDTGARLSGVDSFEDVVYLKPGDPLEPKPEAQTAATQTRKASASAAAAAPASRFRLHLSNQNPIQIQGAPISALLSLDLTAESRPRGMALTGSAWVEQGQVELFSRSYTLEKAKVLFDGQLPLVPGIELLLSHSFNTMTFYLSLRGTAFEPKLKLSSQPAIYDQKELTSFLLGAEPGDDSSQGGNLSRKGASAAANILIAQMQRKIAGDLPVDTISVDLADESDPNAHTSLTVGKWLSRDLFVAYRLIPEANANQNSSEGILRYRLLKRWVFEAIFGDRQNGSAELLWVRRW